VSPPPPYFAAAAVGSGLLAAAVLPGSRVGLGLVLCVLALAAAVALAGFGRPRSPLLAALAAALTSMVLVRDAGWVVALCLVTALALGVLAMTGASTWRALAQAPLAPRPLRGARLLGGSVAGAVPDDVAATARPLAGGLAASLPLLALFGGLFAWADPAFAELAGDALPTGLELAHPEARLALLVAVPTLAAALVEAGARQPPATSPARRRRGTTEWAIALGLLDALFAAFVTVQVAVLFGGDDHVLRTAGLTYAEYAREGFVQLVVVAVLALALVAVVAGTTRPETAWRSRLLRSVLGLLIILTLVVLASALHRLGLYEEAFGFTRLRLGVHAFMLWIGGLFVLALAGIAIGGGRWLPPVVAAGTGLFVLAFALANPDALVAERNLERAAETGRIDAAYLAGLSADAVPALAGSRLPGVRPLLERQAARLAEPDGWAGWNVSREQARRALP
jgi:Domain of unknown function (DUF4173)